MRSNNPRLAIAYSLSGALFYAIMAVLIKIAERSFPNEMIVFFRQVVGLVLFMPLFITHSYPKTGIATSNFQLHLLRAFASISASYCLVYAIKYLPLVDALLLSYTRPLFLPIVAFFWLRKKWKKNVWLGLILGFLGIMLILKPSQRVFDIASLVGLAAGLFGAVAFTAIRRLTKTESADKIFFYYLVISLPLTALPLVRGWTSFTLQQFGIIILIGFMGMLYQMMLTRAYRHAKSYKVGSLLYSAVVFAAVFDWVLEGKIIDSVSIIGIILIAIGSIITLKFTPFNKKENHQP